MSILNRDRLSSDRKTAELEWDELLRLQKALLKAIPAVLLVLDSRLNVSLTNDRYMAWRESDVRDPIGENIRDELRALLLAEPKFIERVKKVLETGSPDSLNGVEYRRNDETIGYLNIQICAITPSNGNKKDDDYRVLLVIDDITEQKVLQQQRDQLARLDSVGRLAGGIAHDFNNILTGVVGYATLLLKKLDNDPDACRELTKICEMCNRATQLIRHLLTFSRQQIIQFNPVNVNEAIKDTVRMVEKIIGEDIHIETIYGAQHADILGASTAIDQIIMNLAVNARDAMPDGGTLTIETENVVFRSEDIGLRLGVKPGHYVLIAVTDTGCGIDKSVQDKVFDPFFTTKSEENGTGLGLATVYGIVKQHGGNVWVYSEPGEGTTFKVYLPCTTTNQKELSSVDARDSRLPGGTETILVVEDEEPVRTVMTRILNNYGYATLTAGTIREAEDIFAAQGHGIHLLFSDIVLPDGKGPALYDRLSAVNPALKVLYTSGFSSGGFVRKGIVDPNAPFLHKPFTPEMLASKVRGILDAAERVS